MKLEHPKSWYKKNSELEGDSEIGAGIPPGAQAHANKAVRLSSFTLMETNRAHAEAPAKVLRARAAARRPVKVPCHA